MNSAAFGQLFLDHGNYEEILEKSWTDIAHFPKRGYNNKCEFV